MNTATPATLTSSAYCDLRELESFLAEKLEIFERLGCKPDSLLFKACEELQELLSSGLERIENSRRIQLHAGPGILGAPELPRAMDRIVVLELELALDAFLLESARETAF